MVSDNPPSIEVNAPSIEDMTQTIHLDPEEVKKQFDRIRRFPILVVGRSNAGKTTLLQCVCKTTEVNAPSIEDMTQTIHLDPEEVKKQFDRIRRFRILVVGRSNAGKTTLLQRVCKTTELPEIYNSNGEKVKYFMVQRHRSLMALQFAA